MHDINDALDEIRATTTKYYYNSNYNNNNYYYYYYYALDELRAVIPYAHGPSVRKLSKIATLLLAKNYILMQVSRPLHTLRSRREPNKF